MFEQNDGVSMGASLCPVIAKILMTELEAVIVDNFNQVYNIIHIPISIYSYIYRYL